MNASAQIHEVWATPLEAGLATWLLYRHVGPASFIMLGVAASESILHIFSPDRLSYVRAKRTNLVSCRHAFPSSDEILRHQST